MEHLENNQNQPAKPLVSTTVRRYRLLEAFAWLIIAAVIVFKSVLPALEQVEFNPQEPSEGINLEAQVMKLQGQWLLAAHNMTPEEDRKTLIDQIKLLEVGSVGQRQRAAVLLGVLDGSSEARESLRRLDASASEYGIVLSESQTRVDSILSRIFSKRKSAGQSRSDQFGSISTDDRVFLRKELGWFGDIAIARTQSGEEGVWSEYLSSSIGKMVLMVIVFVLGGGLVLLGVVGLSLGIIWSVKGRLRALSTGPSGGVFIETFACWLILLIVLTGVLGHLTDNVSLPLLGTVVGFFLSLLAIFWLILRRMGWSEAMRQIGLTSGNGWWREVLAGVAGYAMMLPILAIGVVGTLFLTMLSKALSAARNPFASDSSGAHPIIAMFEDASIFELVLVFVTACVAAPIVEEIAFRGILYRGLRNQTSRLSTALSITLSGLLSGFIFAAIHPQGWVAIPALGSIALAMALAREWRESLIAPMTMHAINNSAVLTFVLIMMS